MGSHMKTTVEIPDPLMAQLREQARERGTTVRALLESAIRNWLEDSASPSAFELKDCRTGKAGLRDEMSGRAWEDIRAAAYEGRGE